MEIYAATFCTMDQDIGANPFWHTCILLSRFDQETKKLQVVDNWGFYGLPTTAQNSPFRAVKISIGLDVDMTGNHGMLRHEDMRSLDVGWGLHGVTFELSEDKFNELDKKCKLMVSEQEQAIDEIVKPLNLHGKEASQTRIYPYEHLSQSIFAIEQDKAKEEHRPSRLKRFALSFNEPRTCKMQAIELLDGIITADQLKRIQGFSKRISRFSGPMEKIFLHSIGPTREHKKRSGEVIHFRDGTDADVKLYWTFPPQEIETINPETQTFLKMNQDRCKETKSVISILQRLEWFFMNTNFENPKCLPYRDFLIAEIRELYESFARLEPKKSSGVNNSWTSSYLWLFSQPRDADEKDLMDKLATAKYLIDSLYSAVVDGWEKTEDESALEEDVESLAVYLRVEKQKQLCGIIGREYLEPEHVAAPLRAHL